MFILDGRGGPVLSLAFAPEPGTLYAAYVGAGVHVWNLVERTPRRFEIPDTTNFGMLNLVPGGRWAHGYINWLPELRRAHGGRGLGYLFVDLATGSTYPFQSNLRACGVSTSPDGTRLFSLEDSTPDTDRPWQPGTSRYRLYCRTVTDAGPRYEWHRDYPVRVSCPMVAAVGPDRCAEQETGYPESVRPGKRIVIRRAADGEIERVLACPDKRSDQLLASPDGTKLVFRSGTELLVWEIPSGLAEEVPSARPEGVAADWDKPPTAVAGKAKDSMDPPAACFHPSGQYLLLANGGPSVIVYDTTNWKQVRKWKWDTGGVLRAVAVSADGTLAAAGGPRGVVVVWDLDL